MFSFMGFLQRTELAHYLLHWISRVQITCFVHQGWTGFQPICDLSFESVNKLEIIRTGWSVAWEFVFSECQQISSTKPTTFNLPTISSITPATTSPYQLHTYPLYPNQPPPKSPISIPCTTKLPSMTFPNWWLLRRGVQQPQLSVWWLWKWKPSLRKAW